MHVSAQEEDGKITFLHKVKMGAVDKSYGIHVASLAKLPNSLVKRAREILDVYENKSSKKHPFTQTSLFINTEEQEEKQNKNDELEKKLKEINPLEITPIEALNILYELKKEIENKQ